MSFFSICLFFLLLGGCAHVSSSDVQGFQSSQLFIWWKSDSSREYARRADARRYPAVSDALLCPPGGLVEPDAVEER